MRMMTVMQIDSVPSVIVAIRYVTTNTNGSSSVKLIFLGSSFPRDILARMSLTSTRKSGVSDEDATRIRAREDVRNKSCVSCSWTLENDTDTRTNGQHYTAAYRRPTI